MLLLSNKHFWLRKCKSVSVKTSVGLKPQKFSPVKFSTSTVLHYDRAKTQRFFALRWLMFADLTMYNAVNTSVVYMIVVCTYYHNSSTHTYIYTYIHIYIYIYIYIYIKNLA